MVWKLCIFLDPIMLKKAHGAQYTIFTPNISLSQELFQNQDNGIYMK